MKLENWCVVTMDIDPYTPPELAEKQLHGHVYGHPGFSDGEIVTTSIIMRVEDGRVITRSGSAYELGEPEQEYEALFPGAKARILKQP